MEDLNPTPYIDYSPVPEGWECPACNEKRHDWLAWDHDELVCGSCGYHYDPVQTQHMDEMEQSGVYPV